MILWMTDYFNDFLSILGLKEILPENEGGVADVRLLEPQHPEDFYLRSRPHPCLE